MNNYSKIEVNKWVINLYYKYLLILIIEIDFSLPWRTKAVLWPGMLFLVKKLLHIASVKMKFNKWAGYLLGTIETLSCQGLLIYVTI